jgi:hypothetical protein
MIDSKRSFLKKWRKLPEKLNHRKKKRRIPEGADVLNTQVLGISEPIVGILRRARGRHTMWLSVMSQKKKL